MRYDLEPGIEVVGRQLGGIELALCVGPAVDGVVPGMLDRGDQTVAHGDIIGFRQLRCGLGRREMALSGA